MTEVAAALLAIVTLAGLVMLAYRHSNASAGSGSMICMALRVLLSARPRAVEPGSSRAFRRCHESGDAVHLRPLLERLELGPAERRLPEDARALIERQHVDPVDFQRVGVADVRRLLRFGIPA